MTPESPELRTERLFLRPYRAEDLDALHALWTDPDVRRYLWDDVVIARDLAEEVLRASLALFEQRGFGQWAVFLQGEPDLIGFCGYRLHEDTPELLFGLLRTYWGRGLATEAARAVLHDGFTRLGFARVVAATDPPNAASVRVLQRLGMRPAGRGAMGGVEVLRFELGRDAFFRSSQAE
jgi:ribosomal-protein-alanine N-acetyltransferase